MMIKRFIVVMTVVATFIVLVGVIMVALGYRPFILTSGSMEPLYPKGSLVLIDTRVSVPDVKVGDVIAYRASTGALVLHRYVGKNKLQGDANDTAQTVKLTKINLIGREKFTIPGLGSVVEKILEHKIIVFVVAGLLVVIACLPYRHKTSEKPK